MKKLMLSLMIGISLCAFSFAPIIPAAKVYCSFTPLGEIFDTSDGTGKIIITGNYVPLKDDSWEFADDPDDHLEFAVDWTGTNLPYGNEKAKAEMSKYCREQGQGDHGAIWDKKWLAIRW